MKGPLDLVLEIAEILDDLGLPYALGGSLASSLLGEPRSTVDVDIAVRLDRTAGDALLDRVGHTFYVPVEAARSAIASRGSFNLLDGASSMKVDVFVVGDGLLDRMQIERRVRVPLPGSGDGIWVTSAEDQVLRKLDWFRQGDAVSDRQWRDVVGILRVHHGSVDLTYLTATADALGMAEELDEAIRQASTTS